VDEHYCRRWIALTILQELQFLQQNKGYSGTLCRAQLSEYANAGQQYLIISVAHPFQAQTGRTGVLEPAAQQNMSVSMCFAVNDNLRSKLTFLTNPANNIPFRVVNEACERCGIFDCRERVAAPIVLQKKRQFAGMKLAVEKLK
jgi:hypothetical protein